MLDYDIISFDEKVNDLLSDFDKPYHYASPDPSVDIFKIAKGHGLKKWRFISSEQKLVFFDGDGTISYDSIRDKHAVILVDGTIAIHEKDRQNEGQYRFNIANELAHVLLGHFKLPAKKDIDKFKKKHKLSYETDLVVAARYETNFGPNNRKEEEDADHFAVNLLVPIYRFQFWEDKTDEEIAKAFKVDVKCIKKRRNEIRDELNEITAAMKLCSIQETVPSTKS